MQVRSSTQDGKGSEAVQVVEIEGTYLGAAEQRLGREST